MFLVLDKFKLGHNFIQWIQTIYATPNATVCTNNVKSPLVYLGRGTRQGCPLSPLLFVIALEPFAELIRNNPMIKGVTTGTKYHKISLYADDTLLFVTETMLTLPHVLADIQRFSRISGYKANLQKSIACPLNISNEENVRKECPISRSAYSFKYLGIQVTLVLDKLFKNNYNSLLENCKKKLQTWSVLLLSLIGKISVIKMSILPKFIYAFNMLPCYISFSFLKLINRCLKKFIWNNKTPRIKLSTLMKSCRKGGLGLPNFLWY